MSLEIAIEFTALYVHLIRCAKCVLVPEPLNRLIAALPNSQECQGQKQKRSLIFRAEYQK
jgi:hypothetical protein